MIVDKFVITIASLLVVQLHTYASKFLLLVLSFNITTYITHNSAIVAVAVEVFVPLLSGIFLFVVIIGDLEILIGNLRYLYHILESYWRDQW